MTDEQKMEQREEILRELFFGLREGINEIDDSFQSVTWQTLKALYEQAFAGLNDRQLEYLIDELDELNKNVVETVEKIDDAIRKLRKLEEAKD